jgi:hypothetical protein
MVNLVHHHDSAVLGDINDFSPQSDYCNFIKDCGQNEYRLYEYFNTMMGLIQYNGQMYIWFVQEKPQDQQTGEETLVDGWIYTADDVTDLLSFGNQLVNSIEEADMFIAAYHDYKLINENQFIEGLRKTFLKAAEQGNYTLTLLYDSEEIELTAAVANNGHIIYYLAGKPYLNIDNAIIAYQKLTGK